MFEGKKGCGFIVALRFSTDLRTLASKASKNTGANCSMCYGLMPFSGSAICLTSLAFHREQHFLGQMGTDSCRSDKTGPEWNENLPSCRDGAEFPPERSKQQKRQFLCCRPGGDISAETNKPVKDVGN